jgi:hypothetical protein
MEQISFSGLDLVTSIQIAIMALGVVCAVFLLLKIWKNK